jgi:hypothetical protein
MSEQVASVLTTAMASERKFTCPSERSGNTDAGTTPRKVPTTSV